MSGHSKWNSIKHKKAITDAKRGKILTKHSKLLIISGKSDPNPETNAALRSAIQNAKADNVPNENIERILKKLSGTDKGAAQISEQVYEGFGPEGIPFVVTALTDNPNRTMPSVRTAFMKNGGTLGSSGSVMFLFDNIGIITIKNSDQTEESLFELAVSSGAEDFSFDEEESEVVTKFSDQDNVRNTLEEQGIKIIKASPEYRAKDPKIISGAVLEKIEKFIEAVEEVEDVDEVFGGFDVA